MITVVAYLTMIGGNLLAVAQRSVKRMLAYSSIAHAGYLLVGFVAGAHAAVRSDATRATLFYLAGYTATALERRDTLAPRNRGADTPLMESGVSAGPGSPGEKREATKVDLDDLPANVLGEIIEGTLYVHPRPRPRHSRVIAAITGSISPPFDIGLGGPGGWWILPEPGIELPDAPEIVPDVAGWRRERLVELPEDALRIVPDWVCEILSPGTRRYDMRVKRPYYAQIGVQHMWVVDYEEQTLQISRLHEGQWLEIGAYAADERVRAEPFEAIELALGGWWGSSK